MSTPDFRAEEPVWVRYAVMTGGGHDKYYEVSISLGDDGRFYVQKRWGRRPDSGSGQIKIESSPSMSYAIGVADAMMAEKMRKGYRLCERPWGAGIKVRRETGQDYYAEGTEAF